MMPAIIALSACSDYDLKSLATTETATESVPSILSNEELGQILIQSLNCLTTNHETLVPTRTNPNTYSQPQEFLNALNDTQLRQTEIAEKILELEDQGLFDWNQLITGAGPASLLFYANQPKGYYGTDRSFYELALIFPKDDLAIDLPNESNDKPIEYVVKNNLDALISSVQVEFDSYGQWIYYSCGVYSSGEATLLTSSFDQYFYLGNQTYVFFTTNDGQIFDLHPDDIATFYSGVILLTQETANATLLAQNLNIYSEISDPQTGVLQIP